MNLPRLKHIEIFCTSLFICVLFLTMGVLRCFGSDLADLAELESRAGAWVDDGPVIVFGAKAEANYSEVTVGIDVFNATRLYILSTLSREDKETLSYFDTLTECGVLHDPRFLHASTDEKTTVRLTTNDKHLAEAYPELYEYRGPVGEHIKKNKGKYTVGALVAGAVALGEKQDWFGLFEESSSDSRSAAVPEGSVVSRNADGSQTVIPESVAIQILESGQKLNVSPDGLNTETATPQARF